MLCLARPCYFLDVRHSVVRLPTRTRMFVSITDHDGVNWTIHVEERREAVLSIDRAKQHVIRSPYLVFVSEFGKRLRSKDPAPDGWEALAEVDLCGLLKFTVGLPPLSA